MDRILDETPENDVLYHSRNVKRKLYPLGSRAIITKQKIEFGNPFNGNGDVFNKTKYFRAGTQQTAYIQLKN